MLLTPIYSQSLSSTTAATSAASTANSTPVSYGSSILIRLYTTMRAEAQLRAEEASRLVIISESGSTPNGNI